MKGKQQTGTNKKKKKEVFKKLKGTIKNRLSSSPRVSPPTVPTDAINYI